MDATTVFTIAKALSPEEYRKLYALMKQTLPKPKRVRKKDQIITREDAIEYLLRVVFHVER